MQICCKFFSRCNFRVDDVAWHHVAAAVVVVADGEVVACLHDPRPFWAYLGFCLKQ